VDTVGSTQRTASRRAGRLGALMAGVGVVQALLLALLYFVPVFRPELPERPDVLAVLVYDPPPPPPPPLPKGSPLRREAARPQPQPVVEKPATPAFVAPVESPQPEPAEAPSQGVRPEEQFGSASGSDLGNALGVEGGEDGGVVGGTLGGVPGGVIGGTGSGPVPDFDAPPRLVRQTRPRYPQEAFVKKVEGTVLVELLIDASGRVARTRVVQSIPLLDAAARETVSEWLFQPARKHGRPVATLANAPVRFRIF
jgi:protein TonB